MRSLALGFVVPFLLLACKDKPAAETSEVQAQPATTGAEVAAPAEVVAEPAKPAQSPSAADAGKPAMATLTLEQTVENYLRAGGAGGDLEAAHALIDARCKDDEKVWKVDPAIMMGSRITIATVKLEIVSQEGDKAVVSATVGGDVKAEQSESDSVMGQKAKVTIKGLEMSGVSLTQPVLALRVDGRWAIGCDATK